MRSFVRTCIVLSVAAGVLASSVPARAHLHATVDAYAVEVGWVTEPTYVGSPNAVYLRLEEGTGGEGSGHREGEDDHGGGAVVRNVDLRVEVIFGADATGPTRTEPLDLIPSRTEAGAFEAPIVPTAPGSYTFHVFGTVAGDAFDATFTSGEAGETDGTRYDDVRLATDIQFPDPVPEGVELTRRLDRIDARLAGVAADADSAGTTGLLGLVIGIVAVLVGGAGFVVGRASKR